MQQRQIGKTGLKMGIMSIGGHGFREFFSRPAPSPEEGVEILKYLVGRGMTHFDCTYSIERLIYADYIEKAGLQGKLKPVLWDMVGPEAGLPIWPQTSADDMVANWRHQLAETGCERAGIAAFNTDPGHPDWWWEAVERIKNDGLAELVAAGIMAGGRVDEVPLYEHADVWDVICPYWNYTLRGQQFMVEFARENGIGVYSVGAFCRGAILEWPGVQPEEFVRPWIKWILREPSVCGFALSVSTLEQAKMAAEACDEKPMSPEEALYFHKMNFPVQIPYYRIAEGETAGIVQEFEVMTPEAHGSNMLTTGSRMIRWAGPLKKD